MLIPAPAAPVKGASRAGKDNSDDDGAAAASAGAGAAVNPVQPVGAPLVLNMPDITSTPSDAVTASATSKTGRNGDRQGRRAG